MNESSTKTLGRFEVQKRLGQGFQGRVYLGLDPVLQRQVALKLINIKDDDTNHAEDLVREARFAAQIAHANVIPLYEVDLFHNTPLLVFEYVEGLSLREYLHQRGKMEETEALETIIGIASGLASAHEKGIVHLDITPNNIMIDKEGRPRIMDFGLARNSTANKDRNKTERLFGTPRYISPEHLKREALTPATDVFSVGLLFYEMLSGKCAFNQSELNDIYLAVEAVDINWGALQYQGLSPEVIAIVRDMCQANASWRFQNAGECLTALQSAMNIQENEDRGALALDFLLRRLEKRPEFPACSTSIGEINRLTDERSNTDFKKLAALIARDYTLTNRVLKIANSVIFDRSNQGVKTISVAISRLGLKLVRMICNGLLLFKQSDNSSSELKDILVASFVAGLIAQALLLNRKRHIAEEAFICSLFHRLGVHLLVFYLPDEYEDINALISRGRSKQTAEREILSTTCSTLGVAVAEKWHFPETIKKCMLELPPGILELPINDEEYLCHAANYANELCDLINTRQEDSDVTGELDLFNERHTEVFAMSSDELVKLIDGTADKFSKLAPGLGVNYSDSQFCSQLANFAETLEASYFEVDEALEAIA
ncbi:MAG: protein kinase [Gammaproteobacteria bacterium]|nr:protein kinase [Gammaproteobacteria bacterium]